MKIKEGAKKKITEPINEIKFTVGSNSIQLWINDTLSYIDIQEAVGLKRELDKAINDHIYEPS